MTGSKRNTHQLRATAWVKRGLTLAFLTLGLLVLLDQLGFNLTSLAQRRQQRANVAQTNASITDCAYLKDPESFRSAQLRHRREVSSITEELSAKLSNKAERLVSASDIPH